MKAKLMFVIMMVISLMIYGCPKKPEMTCDNEMILSVLKNSIRNDEEIKKEFRESYVKTMFMSVISSKKDPRALAEEAMGGALSNVTINVSNIQPIESDEKNVKKCSAKVDMTLGNFTKTYNIYYKFTNETNVQIVSYSE